MVHIGQLNWYSVVDGRVLERVIREQIETICEALFRTNSSRSLLRVLILWTHASLLPLCLDG